MLNKTISIVFLGMLALSVTACKKRDFSGGSEASSTPAGAPGAGVPVAEPATVLDAQKAAALAQQYEITQAQLQADPVVESRFSYLSNDILNGSGIIPEILNPRATWQVSILEVRDVQPPGGTNFKYGLYLRNAEREVTLRTTFELRLESFPRGRTLTVAEFRAHLANHVRALVGALDAEFQNAHEELVRSGTIRPQAGQRYAAMQEAALRLLADEATRARVPMNWETIGEFRDSFANLQNEALKSEITRSCNTGAVRAEAERRNAARTGGTPVTPAEVLVERLEGLRQMAESAGKATEFATLLERVSARLLPKR